MLIIEALKLIGNKTFSIKNEVAERIGKIRKVASKPSDEKTLEYGTPGEQALKVAQLVQGAQDKVMELARLRHAVYLLNVTTSITIRVDDQDVTKSVDHWIHRKDTGIPLERQILTEGLKDVPISRDRIVEVSDGKGGVVKELVQLVRYYDVATKDKALEVLLEEERAIESALDRFNCTTEIPADLLS
jgi:hypothetical protein